MQACLGVWRQARRRPCPVAWQNVKHLQALPLLGIRFRFALFPLNQCCSRSLKNYHVTRAEDCILIHHSNTKCCHS